MHRPPSFLVIRDQVPLAHSENGLSVWPTAHHQSNDWRLQSEGNSRARVCRDGHADAATTGATTTNSVSGKPISGEAAIAQNPTFYPLTTNSTAHSVNILNFKETDAGLKPFKREQRPCDLTKCSRLVTTDGNPQEPPTLVCLGGLAVPWWGTSTLALSFLLNCLKGRGRVRL